MIRSSLLSALALGLLVTSCSPADQGLRVTVTLKPSAAAPTVQVKADCVRLTVLDGTTALASVTARRPGDQEAVFAVKRTSDMPATVRLQAEGLLGDCAVAEALKLNARTTPVSATFPEQGFTEQALVLEPPAADLDGDRDGFAGTTKGGVDCDDAASTVFPGSVQLCTAMSDTDCDGLSGCDDSDCDLSNTCANPPDRVTITPAVEQVMRHECFLTPFHLELANAQGPRVAVRDTTVTLATSQAGLTVHLQAGCGDDPVSAVHLPYGASGFDFYVKADARPLGDVTVTATAARVATPGTATVIVRPTPATTVRFTTPPRTVTAGTCSADEVTVELTDAAMRPTVAEMATALTFATGLAMPVVFSDATCATPTTTVSLQPGQGAATVRLKSDLALAGTLTATTSTGLTASQPFTIEAGEATQVAFANQPLSVQATEACSPMNSPLVLELRDALHNPTTRTVDTLVDVSVTGLTGAIGLFPASGCSGSAVTSVTISAGQSAARLWVKPGDAGQGAVTATPPAGVGSAVTQALSVPAGPPHHFEWSGAAQTPLAGACSAMPLTLLVRDSAGGPTSFLADSAVTLSTTPAMPMSANFGFFTDATCTTRVSGNSLTFPAGQSQVLVYFRGEKAGGFTVTAARSGVTSATSSGHGILPEAPSKLAFVAPLSQTTTAGVCTAQAFEVRVLDPYDNPTSYGTPQTLTVSAATGTVTVGTGTSCGAGNTVALPATATSATFTATSTVARAYTLSASTGQHSTTNTAALTVNPGPTTLVITTPALGSASVTAGDCVPVTVARQDSYGNPINVTASATVSLGNLAAAGFTASGSADCSGGTVTTRTMAANTNTVSFSVRPTVAGVKTTSLSMSGPNIAATLTLTVAAGPHSLVVTAPTGGTMTATAGTCRTVTVTRQDTWGNQVPTTAVRTLTVSAVPGMTLHTASNCSGGVTDFTLPADTSSFTFYVRPTQATSTPATVTMTLDGQSTSFTLTVNPATANHLELLAPVSPPTLQAGGCVPTTVQLHDAFHNPVNNTATSNLTFGTLPAGTTAHASVDCSGASTTAIPVTTTESGKAFSLKPTRTGASTVQLTLASLSVSVGMTVTAAPAASLTFVGLPQTVSANTCSAAVSLQRHDTYGNLATSDGVASATVTLPATVLAFTASDCSGAGSQTPTLSFADKAATSSSVYLRSTTAAAHPVTASLGSLSAAGTFTVSPGAATAIELSGASGTVTAGVCLTPLTVRLLDAWGNAVTPTANTAVDMTSNDVAMGFSSGPGCTVDSATVTIAAGTSSKSWSVRPGRAGSTTVTGARTGLTSGTLAFTTVAGAPAGLAWKTPPTATPSRFACVSAGELQVVDGSGNVTPATSAVTVTPTSSAAGAAVTFFTDAACTTLATTGTIAAGGTSLALYLVAAGTGSTNLAATGTGLATPAPNQAITVGGATGVLSVTPATADVEAGGCVEFTVRRQTAALADITVGATPVTVSVPASEASVTLHTDAACSGTTTTSVSAAIAHGSATSRVWVRGRSTSGTAARSVTLTVDDTSGGCSDTSATLSSYPLVRRGDCNLSNSNTTARCTLTPAIPGNDVSRSFLVFSSTGSPVQGNAITAANANVECHLEPTMAGVDVVCTRQGTQQVMDVSYQVVSWGRGHAQGGVTVRHLTGSTDGVSTTTDVPIGATVPLAESFLLFSAASGGATNGTGNFPVARLIDTSTARITMPVGTATDYSLQVVSFAGAAVTRAVATNKAGAAFTEGSLSSVTTSRAFFLYSAAVTTNTAAEVVMCKRRLLGRMPDGTSLSFRRGGATPTSTDCSLDNVSELAWERVQLPSGHTVQHPAPTDLTTTATSGATPAFTAVAPHRSIVFMAGQGPGGQSAGDSTWFSPDGQAGDDTGPFHGRIVLGTGATETTATIHRVQQTDSTSSFAPFIVQFAP